MRILRYRSRLFGILSVFLIIAGAAALLVASLSIQVRTVGYGGHYSPKNVGAIWIEDANGTFIRTVKIWANARKKHLVKWNAASGGNTINAVTGATVSSHRTHTVSWDCADYNGTPVADGNYVLWMEYTEDNSKYSGEPKGPFASIPFTKAGTAFTLTPPDEPYFKDIQLIYDPGGPTYTLTTNTNGSGTISMNPPGGHYAPNTTVELTATASAGWEFSGWSGDVTGTQNPVSIVMTANKTVTANFTQVPTYTLTVQTTGSGNVSLNPSGGTYNEGTQVTLTASPDFGWEFANWSGDASGTSNSVTVTMNANKTVTANFSEIVGFVLQVSTSGGGSVILSPTAPNNIYNSGTVVTLRAEPDANWFFDHWSGDLSGTDSVQTITMNAHKQVTAVFGTDASQEIIAGTNRISDALANAVDGDVIVLKSSGGEYSETGTVTIDKKITIMAAPGLPAPPVWKTNAAIAIDVKNNLTLQGIVLDGQFQSNTGIWNSSTTPNSIELNSVEIKDFNDFAVAQDLPATLESISITKSFIHHCGRGVYLRGNPSGSPENPGANHVYMQNVSVYNIGAEGVRFDGFGLQPSGSATFDHLTINDCGDEGLYLKGYDQFTAAVSSVIVTNCGVGIKVKSSNPVNVTFSDVWNNNQDWSSHAFASVGTISSDPMFVNAEFGDFSLNAGSPCIGTGNGGTNMGSVMTSFTTGIDDETDPHDLQPVTFAVIKNYPNPFNPITTLEFYLPQSGIARLTVYNALGQQVDELLNEILPQGNHKVQFNAASLPSGVYMYRLESRASVVSGKMLLVK